MNKNNLVIAEYEQQLRINPQDVATRWKLVKARYEVVTIGDKLLLGRLDMPRIYTDRDAKMVLGGLEGEEKARFLGQIKNLAACQEALIKAEDTDSICDIYLAFDASSSEDAEIAQDIYQALSKEGISVYYEPERRNYGEVDAHRLFALHHAKLLILVGTSVASIRKEATAGAWMRYLNMMERDAAKHILPAYKHMNPKDFPREFSKTQGIDVGRIGSVQAILVPRVLELIGAHDQVIVVKRADGKSVNITNLLNRIEFFLEDGEFEAAHARIINFEKEYGTDFERLHYLKLLEQAKARNQKELALAVNEDLLDSPDYKYLIEKGSPKMKEELLGLEEKKVAYQKEQKEDAYVEAIKKAHVDGKYDKVLMLVKEVKTMRGFSRWADIQGFYQTAKTRVENQKLREEFRKLVGNGKDFYYNQLKEKEPDKYQVLTALTNIPRPDRTTGIWALTGIICLIILLVCRFCPVVDLCMNCLTFGVLACFLCCIITSIREKGLVGAIIKGGFCVVLPIIILVLIINIIYTFIPGLIDVIAWIFGLLTGFPVEVSPYSGIYADYNFDTFRIAFIFAVPVFVFLIRGLKALKIYRRQKSVRQSAEKEYRQLRSSGFLEDFEKREYVELVKRYKEVMGSDWIEPVKITERGRK